MKIKRILNNNAVVAFDQHNQEIILKGKGIAFKKSAGDEIDELKIEQKFVSEENKINRRYEDLLINIPFDVVEVSDKAIQIIKKEVHHELSDNIYITLTDHISNLLERVQLGIEFDSSLLWDVKRMYKEEYAAGTKVVDLIKKEFDIKFQYDEASFIALHIVNATLDNQDDMDRVIEVTTMINDICDIVSSQFDINTDEDDLNYNRFVLHLRFFFERVLKHQSLEANKSDQLLVALKNEYPEQYKCVEGIVKYIGTRFKEPIEGEILFLMVHVVKLTS